jgi:hypothetical protein
MAINPNLPGPGLNLEYPMSLGVYDDYTEALAPSPGLGWACS